MFNKQKQNAEEYKWTTFEEIEENKIIEIIAIAQVNAVVYIYP